ncbi:MAG: tetratricopeptide repeat protein, partial [Candidatus Pacebacteria bacterium]|nr:tetratricopeptide repeat protein [Candidatus Paceibacterota bacterium]
LTTAPRLLAAVLGCTLILLLAASPQCPARESPREVRENALMALSQGDYEGAIPYLLQLIDYLGDNQNPNIVRLMEPIYFNLGLCYYLTGQFSQSEEAFNTYIKRYPNGKHVIEAAVFIPDGYRFTGDYKKALKTYKSVLENYSLNDDWKTDVLCSMARCALADNDWETALPFLEQAYAIVPDSMRQNWIVTLLATAYLQELQLEKVFPLIPYLMAVDSFAARSIAFNMAALEVGDFLFASEQYRYALWVYRMVYPREVISQRSQAHLDYLHRYSARLRRIPGKYRELLRVQETIGELEAEIEALKTIDNYDIQLFFRISRAYMEVRRYREALAGFLYLVQQTDGEQAEEALFLAFHCATRIRPWDDAFQLGRQYMDDYPKSTYYDRVSLALGQMRASRKEWPEVIAVLTEALGVSPQHESIAECMFLLGYASFMEEEFSDAVRWLRRLQDEYPENERAEEGTYWLGMSLLFNQNYEFGRNTFADFLADYPESTYHEDATFRYAVCDYGLSNFNAAEQGLLRFVKQYPESTLGGEAWMMLADISGFFGENSQAVTRYQRALEHDLNIEFYNYCQFRCGEILHGQKRFDDLITHFRRYVDANREGSNIPQAIYWIVKGICGMRGGKTKLSIVSCKT